MDKKNKVNVGVVLILIVGILTTFLLYIYQKPRAKPMNLSKSFYEFEALLEDSQITPIPQSLGLDEDKVTLGERLFQDTRLSKDNSISCASCHNLMLGGTVPLAKPLGMNEQIANRNAPTVFNSGFNIAQFWDGRAETLEDQIDGPVTNSKEMGADWPSIVSKLKEDNSYIALFSRIYSNGITEDSIKNAIATYERSLITPNSRFDHYLRGDHDALDQEEVSGYKKFKSLGCSSCHQGVNLGSNLYQKFGIFVDTPQIDNSNSKVDLGRFAVTKNNRDKFVFKVPTLRNIALTAPYFHDGSATTLEEAVRVMGLFQLGRNLEEEEIKQLVSFLKTLTGEYKGRPL